MLYVMVNRCLQCVYTLKMIISNYLIMTFILWWADNIDYNYYIFKV